MPDQLKVHPGERVDLVDYVHGANTYTQESQKFLMEREVLDRRSRILDGFRIKIEDQVANPGMITVYNGNALDRDGQLINNETLVNDSRSITLLGANLNFYVEIEFIINASTVDARFLWDPTTPNVAPEPDGSEFGLNVATRLTPDWRIVNPVSTTSFQQTSNANSVRVPVGVFRTDGANQIVVGSNPGLVLVRAASVLETDVALGASTIRVVDARMLPATTPFNVTLDFGGTAPEAVVVSGVDRDNGIVTLTAPIAANHSAGAIVRVTSGTADLVREATDPNAANPLAATPEHPDLAQRMWQANEVRGSGLMQSKETFGVRDDLNIRSLKDEIDFLSAQLRELKFGHARPEVVSTAPPVSFSTRPRYFDRAGSVTGARSNTVSIGNGTTTFGDLNGTDGSALLTAAMAALPASGGTIYIKNGTYTFASTVNVAKAVVIVGEHFNTTILQNTNAGGPAISATANMRFVNISLQRTGGASTNVLEAAGAVNFNFDYCTMTGNFRMVGVNAGIIAANSTFTQSGGTGIFNGSTVASTLSFSTFQNCFLSAAGIIFNCAMDNVRVHHCNLVATTIVSPLAGACNINEIYVRDSLATIAFAVVTTNATTGAVTGCTFENNRLNSTLLGSGQGIFYFANTGTVDRVRVRNNYSNITGGVTSAVAPGFFVYVENNTSSTDLQVDNNQVDTLVGSFVVPVQIDQDTLIGRCSVKDNYFFRTLGAVRIGGPVGTIDTGELTIAGNVHDDATEHASVYGVLMMNDGRLDRINILDNTFVNYNSSSLGTRRGVDLTSNNNTSPGPMVQVRGNKFIDLTDPSVGTDTSFGVIFDAAFGGPLNWQFEIHDNFFYRLSGDLGAAAIFIRNTNGSNSMISRVCRNQINRIGEDATTAFAYGIYLENHANSGLQPSVMVSENSIYRIVSSTGLDAASGVEIRSCQAAQVQNNYIASIRSNTAATASTGGCGIRVRGTLLDGMMVADNHINQGLASVPGDARLGIVLLNEGTITGWAIRNNHIRSSTSGYASIWAVGDTAVYRDGVVFGNIIVDRTTVSFALGGSIFLHINADSYNIAVDGNVIEETTYSANCATHRGINIQGNDVGGQPRAICVRNNTLVGPKAGALVSAATRVGIWFRGALKRTICTGNMIDWNEPAVLEGIGIKYNDDVASGGPWSGHLCAANFVRGDNSGAAGGEVDITTAQYTNGFLDTNQLGEPGAVGTIVPGAAAGGWTYGTNKLT